MRAGDDSGLNATSGLCGRGRSSAGISRVGLGVFLHIFTEVTVQMQRCERILVNSFVRWITKFRVDKCGQGKAVIFLCN